MKTKHILLIIVLLQYSISIAGDWRCVDEVTKCSHKIDGKCAESEIVCLEAVKTDTVYSQGCDLSSVMKMVNQSHCDVQVVCNDPIITSGTCFRGSGCYPGTYVDTCPSAYDVRFTGDNKEGDCATYDQTGSISLQKYEYGHFSGGAAMTLAGGEVTCQTYYGPRKNSDCSQRLLAGERPGYCLVDECADLAANPRCSRIDSLGITHIGNETTILNTDCVWIMDPVNGKVCSTDPNAVAENTDDIRLYDVKVEAYKCETADVRNCENKEYMMVCPDGSETLCQLKKTCREEQAVTYNVAYSKNIQANRKYNLIKCNSTDGSCNAYSSNPSCIHISDTNLEVNGKYTIINGWDSNGASKNCYIEYAGGCREISPDSSSWEACVNYFESNVLASFNAVFPYKVSSINKLARIGDLGDFSSCYGASNNSYDQHVELDVTYIVPHEQYYCYADYVLNTPSNCTLNTSIAPLCLAWEIDITDTSKAQCKRQEYEVNCSKVTSELECVDYDEEIICEDQDITLPKVALENDTMTDFGPALGILGILDDINSLWSGEHEECSYGFFNNSMSVYCNNCKGSGTLCFNKKPRQQKAYKKNKKGLCHYLETVCSKKIDVGFGSICIEHTKEFCCYDSKLARILVEQSYLQLNKNWDDGCNGLTMDDLNNLDWSAMDLSEFEEELQHKINTQAEYYNDSLKDQIKGYYEDFSDQMDQTGTHPKSK